VISLVWVLNLTGLKSPYCYAPADLRQKRQGVAKDKVQEIVSHVQQLLHPCLSNKCTPEIEYSTVRYGMALVLRLERNQHRMERACRAGADPGFPEGRFTTWMRMRTYFRPRPLKNHAHKPAASLAAW
jgi:hypothetical protein